MHMRCIKWQGFHTIPSTIMLQQSRLFCIILKEHGTKAFIYPQIGHLSSPVMLIHTLEYYFGSEILKILHQSNQELGISLNLECSYPMSIKTSNSNCSFYHGSRIYCFMPFNAWSLLLREVIKEIYIKVFKKEVTSGCSTHSKEYFETIEEKYPASIVYKHNASC